MEETMLTLKPGATLIELNGQIGILLNDRAKYTKDDRQSALLSALVLKNRPLESLKELIQAQVSGADGENEISLAIAEFILDFGEYLES